MRATEQAAAANAGGPTQDVQLELLCEQARSPAGAVITCNGHSMEPTVHVGDRVRVWAVPGLRSGDAVAFVSLSGQLMLHRVVFVAARAGWFAHVGDAGYDDAPGVAPLSGIIGRADLPRRTISWRTRAAALRRAALGVARQLRRGAT